MKNPFEDIDLEKTAELPKVDDQPKFPSMPDELGSNDDYEPLFPDVPKEFGDENINETKPVEETMQIPTSDNGGNNNVPPTNDKNTNKKKKQPKKGEFKKNPVALNIIVTIITIIANVLVTLVLFNTTRFSSLSQNIFLAINIGVLAALVLLDLLVILMIRTRKIAMFVITCIVLSLFVGVGGYGFYALGRVNNNVNKITAETKEEEVSASLVIYSGTSGDPITDVSDLEGRRVGVSSGSTTEEIAKNKISSEGINVEYVEVNGYTELLTQLISGGVDCAVLPVTYQSQFSDDENLSAYLADTQSILDFSDTVTSTSDSGADKDITKEPFTVLVTGENEGLADSIILMSVNPVSMKVTMTSIARDSYVPISCYGSSDKINAAHASSESCMVKTVENLMGIDIDYTIEFNFASVVQVVDAVGGVDVDVTEEFDAQGWDVENDELAVFHLYKGYQHLNGATTLGYVRERHAFADGDFARQRHQQEVIEQIIQKLLSSNSPQLFLDVLDAAGDNIKTNFTVDQMTSFINYALQKTKRYYNQGSIAGIFNFESSRVYGYAANLWNSSLQMDLWIYRLFNGSIEDCAAAIERNLSTTDTPDTPTAVSWSAANTYTPDPVSQETYDETRITDDGRPAEVTTETESTPTPESTSTTDPNQNSQSSSSTSDTSTGGNTGSGDGSGTGGSSGDTSGSGTGGGTDASGSSGSSGDTSGSGTGGTDSGSTDAGGGTDGSGEAGGDQAASE
jgi:polyisoprenyl-teichoic acid--peptidoglycan teichoic acid transferase